MDRPNVMKTIRKMSALLLVASALLCVSCKPGLGTEVDMDGPVLTVQSPEYMQNVNRLFTVTGTVRDDHELQDVVVSTNASNAQWRLYKGAWQYRSSGDASWESCTTGIVTAIDGGGYEWSVTIDLGTDEDGEYVVSVIATDMARNSDSASFQERMVVVDNNPPVVNISNPVLFEGTLAENEDELDDLQLQSLQDIRRLYNGSVPVRWNIDEPVAIASLRIRIADAAGQVYAERTLTTDEGTLNLNGALEIPASELLQSDNTVLSEKTYLQVITTARDGAGNVEENKSHGWFVWWPAADTPWIVCDLSTNSGAPSTVIPGYEISGQSYDDDGIDQVSISLYQGTGTTTLLDTETVENSEGKGSFNWKVSPPRDTGDYTLVAEARDIQGTVSETFTGYFEIEDINTPVIEISSPDQQDPLFGDADGNFVVSGIAHDDTGIDEVRLVWIDPDQTDPAQSRLAYTNAEYTEWDETGPDIPGNMRWNLTLGTEYRENQRSIRDFSQTLNLFTDLGVAFGTSPLRNYTFMLRAKDDNDNYRVVVFSTSGDRSRPDFTLDTLTVRDSGSATKMYNFEDMVETFRLPQFETGDSVSLSGTWDDDSLDAWNNTTRYQCTVAWGSTSLIANLNQNGTWYTTYHTPPEGTVANIWAELVDIGNNTTTRTKSFLIETDEAALVRITSPNVDGTYPAGKTITIRLDFNKAVTVTGGTPSLALSGGYTAGYTSGSGTASLAFTWTVPSGANIADLDVTAINQNGCTFTVVETVTELVPELPTDVYSLGGGKNIAIDTTDPTIRSVRTSASPGAYGAGRDLYFTVTFSEPIVCSGSPLIGLTNGAEAVFYAQPNSTSMIFLYTVDTGDDIAALDLDTELTLNGATIADAAGNTLDTSFPAVSLPVIRIDTTAPGAPVINGVSANTTYYEAVTVTLSNLETGCDAEYSVDGGSTWLPYSPGGFELTRNGTYDIVARQTDAAGNEHESAAVAGVTLDIGNLIRRISALNTDGVYTSGTLTITMHMRKPINVTGTPRLALNIGVTEYAVYSGRSDTETLKFEYTIVDGADVTRLDVTAIDWNGGAFVDTSGKDVSSECTLPDEASGNRLTDQKNIEIVTGEPEVTGVTLSGTLLTIAFNRKVNKGSGVIILEQDADGYRVPIAMSESEWEEVWNSASATEQTELEGAYTLGTNGADENGVPDTSAKYVLNFDRDPNDGPLITVFRGTNVAEHIVEIPVVSSMVSIVGKEVRVTLTGAYALPTRGADYTVTIPAGLIQDNYSNPNPGPAVTTVTHDGVEPPVIRIQKGSETYAHDRGGEVRATQPLTASVKIHCRTPGAEIYYTTFQQWFPTEPIDAEITKAPGGTKPTPRDEPDQPGTPTTNSTPYSSKLTIGNTGDRVSGLKYRIRARARTNPPETWSDDAWETAYRSVLRMDNNGGVSLDRNADDGYSDTLIEQPWVRGGDAVTGSVLTPGFPLSWDIGDYDGIRLMTQDTDDPNVWYWVSWDINTTAYVGLLLGSTSKDVTDTEKNGPTIWGWGKNAWVPFKEYYPLFPGESRTLALGDYDLGRGGFDFATTTQGGTTKRPKP